MKKYSLVVRVMKNYSHLLRVKKKTHLLLNQAFVRLGSCDNVQTERSIFEYANWPRLCAPVFLYNPTVQKLSNMVQQGPMRNPNILSLCASIFFH